MEAVKAYILLVYLVVDENVNVQVKMNYSKSFLWDKLERENYCEMRGRSTCICQISRQLASKMLLISEVLLS